ncbi:MAG TPA: cytochrome d ubiquinol oxidase subunit II [Bacteroidales bacterium]|nr:cytochrome d ubiquinol oxidase subunit II [Bacteroidales bacterium]
MITSISFLALQQYWWLLVSVLGAILVFLMFVQGGQTFIFSMGKTELERSLLVNTLGRKWEFTFTTLVTFGGAFFASFPLFYSTSFGGAYWVWTLALLAFVVQAVAYEFRSKPSNVLGKKTFEVMLFLNGLLGTVLIGTAVGTFYNGANFSHDFLNHVDWHHPARGLEAVLNLHNVLLGLTVFLLSRVLGLLYFLNTIDHETIVQRSKKCLLYNAIPFVVAFLSFTIWLMLKPGFAVNPDTAQVYMQDYKYLINLIEMPVVLVMFLLGVVGVLFGIIRTLWPGKTYDKGIWFSGIGTFLTVLSLFLIAGYNNTAFYPSLVDINQSLTITNASSSMYTLKAMSVVSLLIPFVLAYIVVAWRSINKKKIDKSEIEDSTEHNY